MFSQSPNNKTRNRRQICIHLLFQRQKTIFQNVNYAQGEVEFPPSAPSVKLNGCGNHCVPGSGHLPRPIREITALTTALLLCKCCSRPWSLPYLHSRGKIQPEGGEEQSFTTSGGELHKVFAETTGNLDTSLSLILLTSFLLSPVKYSWGYAGINDTYRRRLSKFKLCNLLRLPAIFKAILFGLLTITKLS